MTRMREKRPRTQLEPDAYRELWMQVLKRDGWRCQGCGALTGLQVHHMKPRSSLGDDAETNLITLCVNCHLNIHQPKRKRNRFPPKQGS
jgi:5-methylcytosine-specific restriction endonuclease McrA